MNNILSMGIVGILVISAFGAVALKSDVKISDDTNLGNRVFTHAVFTEDGSATWCGPCDNAHQALKNIHQSGDYPFYYTTLVDDKNTHAAARLGEYNLGGFPTVFFDGGNTVVVGGWTGAEAAYRTAITQTGARVVADIDVTLNVTWYGNAAMNIKVAVHNNEATQYSGRIRVYITELGSTMGWKDTTGHVYTCAFLDYAFNQDISITSGNTWTASAIWDGHNYNDGYGHNYGNIQYGNIEVIAVVFNSEAHQGYADPPFGNPFTAYWVDNATGVRVGCNTPPNTANAPTPTNGSTNVDIHKQLSWMGGDVNPFDTVTYDVYCGTTSPPPKVASNQSSTTYTPGTMNIVTNYYWKIVAWDNNGASAAGPIWQFITENNNPPNKPGISGEAHGKAVKPYTYVFTATDPDQDTLSYFVDWGDDTSEQWNGPHASGSQVSITHTWTVIGTYTIKAKVKDIHNAESSWGTLEIKIPRDQFFSHSCLLQFLHRTLERFPSLERLFLQ